MNERDEYVRHMAFISAGMRPPEAEPTEPDLAVNGAPVRFGEAPRLAASADRQGRQPTDPLFSLPHSKCSCLACAKWRLENASRLTP